MKKFFVIFAFFFIWIFSCNTKEDIEPTQTTLVGKWTATGRMQSQNADGTWSDWYVLETFAAVPVSIWEFTSDGRFLRDGKAGAECCFAGNKYSVSGNEISFTDLAKPCMGIFCINCKNWSYKLPDADTLILDECYVKKEYYRVK